MFDQIQLAPADPILGLNEAYQNDPRATKVNLGVGVYLNESGKMPLLRCAKEAEQRMAADPVPHSYLGIDGLKPYVAAAQGLAFGMDAAVLSESRIASVQTLAGTGALRLGADFLHQLIGTRNVLISDPSWENHRAIFTRAGYEVSSYRYYTPGGVDFDGMLADLRAAEPGTLVVLHACCHNPTGYDLTSEQWDQAIQVLAEQQLVPFVDMAYQGFGNGLFEDNRALTRLVAAGMNFLCAMSFSKSFGLYGERVGALHAVAESPENAKKVLSQLKVLIRANYSNPPTFGAKVVANVLSDPQLRASWEEELAEMRDRIKELRGALVAGLEKHGVTDMGFINDQIGMFSYSGLSKEQMIALRTEHGVYGTDTGRMCVAALNDKNLDYVTAAIAAVQ